MRSTLRLLATLTFGMLLASGCTDPGNGGGGWHLLPDNGGQCQPDCFFKQCGDDGCGGSCGFCSGGLVCHGFQCLLPQDFPDVPGVDISGGWDTGPDIQPSGLDSDGDGVDDAFDNCKTVPNEFQEDLDSDLIGDACDPDIDGDKYINDLDCDPFTASVHPGAHEMCHNNVDDDCDGGTDEENAHDCKNFYIDEDGDGAGHSSSVRCLCLPEPPHVVKIAGDCDDASGAFSPLVEEVCDGVDNNCNLLIDEGCDDDGDGFCDSGMTVIGTPAVCPQGGGDCYDYSAAVHPGATEIEGDDVDNDCDGVKAGEGGGPIDCSCQNACVGATVNDFLCAIDMCCNNLVMSKTVASVSNDTITGAWGAISHYGYTSNDLAPFKGLSYAVMGSGAYNDLDHQNMLPGDTEFATDPFSKDGYDDMHDSVEYRLKMQAPAGATGFSIDYIFMSAEYHEWVGTQFNDKFYIILRAPQTTGNIDTVVNFATCLNPNVYYDKIVQGQKVCYIAINAAFAEPCPNQPTDLSGTGHECAADGSSTGWLTTKWPIQGGEVFDLTFHIHDTGDEVWDSTVLIDNFQWEGGEFQSGTFSHN